MPLATDSRLKIAVFVDFDNIEIGVKSTLGTQFDVGAVLEAIKERGDIISKVAYGDWKRAGDHSRLLGQHAVRLVQRNLTPGGDKNGADINLALDALEMALTHPHINAFVIVGGDSDFITLVEKLKQYDKQVIVVGGRQFTSIILQKNCHEFIAYENLVKPQGGRQPRERARPSGQPAVADQTPLSQVFPLVTRALGILSEREVSPQLGLLKSTLLQLDSTFSERDYGASTFRDFVQKLAEAGLVTTNQAGRNVFVELRGDAPAEARAEEPPPSGAPSEEPQPPTAHPGPVVEQAGTPEDAVRIVRAALDHATSLRWPMYIRNVKQIVKAFDQAFDERRYGFGGVLDLLRACQRDGLLRLERDRKGALRVFAGTSIQRPADVEAESGVPARDFTAVIDDMAPMAVAGALSGFDVAASVPTPAAGPAGHPAVVDAKVMEPGETSVAPAPSGEPARGSGKGKQRKRAAPATGSKAARPRKTASAARPRSRKPSAPKTES